MAGEKSLRLLFPTSGVKFQALLLVLPQPSSPTPGKLQGREGKKMYLKEGDIGKAESEEVVPVKTEMEIVSPAGFAGRSPASSWLLPPRAPGLGAIAEGLW